MKLNRKTLLWITAGLGVFLIAYSLVRHFTSFSIDEKIEKYIMDGIIFAALGLFVYNRKLSSDERKAKEAAEKEELKAAEPPEDDGNENLPHWERSAPDSGGTSDGETDDDETSDGEEARTKENLTAKSG
ncbi:MAG: hypothetical protein LBI67_09690 [Treponema sp.]|jgi:hypothetical protein|nr:hypothetical protein [Treponema sp.]